MDVLLLHLIRFVCSCVPPPVLVLVGTVLSYILPTFSAAQLASVSKQS